MTPSLIVVVCAVAHIADVQATSPDDPDFWGDPQLSSNGLAKWGVWEVQVSPEMRTALEAIPTCGLYASDDAANLATGWVE